MGLFKPAWQKDDIKNESRAFKEVKKENNQTKLIEIATKAAHMRVREAAIEKLTEQSCIEIVKNKNIQDWWVRRRIIKNLTNQSILFEIATDKNNVYDEAIKKLTNESIIEIAKNENFDIEVRKEAMRNLNDQSVFFEMAKKDSDYLEIRQVAVGLLIDKFPSSITDIVKNKDNSSVKEVIAKVKHTRSSIIELINLNDQNLLVEIANYPNDYWNIIEIIENLNKEHLEKLIKSSNDCIIRSIVVAKLFSVDLEKCKVGGKYQIHSIINEFKKLSNEHLTFKNSKREYSRETEPGGRETHIITVTSIYYKGTLVIDQDYLFNA